MNRIQIRAVVGLLTGHCALKGHLHRMGLYNGELKCRLCNRETETAHHILTLDRKRQAIYGHPKLCPKDYSTQAAGKLYKLVQGPATGMGSRTCVLLLFLVNPFKLLFGSEKAVTYYQLCSVLLVGVADHLVIFIWLEVLISDAVPDPEYYLNNRPTYDFYKQNCRIWGSENPHVVKEKPMHPARVSWVLEWFWQVWCGFWSGGFIIGSYFFQNGVGKSVTINGMRYRDMLTDFLWPRLDDFLDELCFQQDGAT
ncbi:hypothetical protein NQ318_014484, partial [Aromia moschata]